MDTVLAWLPDLSQADNAWLWAALALVLAIGFILGWLLFVPARRQLLKQQRELALALDKSRFTVETERKQHQILTEHIKSNYSELREQFEALSARALRDNNEAFLQLAKQNFEQQKQQHSHALEQRSSAIEQLVSPIQTALSKTEQQLQNLEKERKQAYGEISAQLKLMADSQGSLQQETQKLVGALKRPEVRGQWGELTLRRLAELSGMVDRCDFIEQAHTAGSGDIKGQSVRPDMIVQLPEQRCLVVDVKTPLDAYLRAVEATDDGQRKLLLDKHANKVRERVRELAAKNYWDQFEQSPEFVILFIPGDQFLSAALERDADLLEFAMQQRVILATPSSLVALLRAVAYGWRQLALAENAQTIRDLASELYARLNTFTEHLGRVGKNLSSSVEHYNKAVGSLERSVLPSARRFTELGLSVRKEIDPLEPIDSQPRTIGGPASDPDETSEP